MHAGPNPTNGLAPSDAGPRPSVNPHALTQLLREAVRVRRGDPGEWASAIAMLLHAALIDHTVVEPNSPGRVLVEVIDTTTGRCIEIGASKPLFEPPSNDPPSDKPRRSTSRPTSRPALRSHADRTLADAFSTSGAIHLRALARGFDSAVALTPAAESDLRLALTVAVETFAEHLIRPDRRRLQLLERLTESQRRILPFLIDDLSEREIGKRVGRSPHTVHDHVKGIYATLAVSSRRELLALWYADQPPRNADPSV